MINDKTQCPECGGELEHFDSLTQHEAKEITSRHQPIADSWEELMYGGIKHRRETKCKSCEYRVVIEK